MTTTLQNIVTTLTPVNCKPAALNVQRGTRTLVLYPQTDAATATALEMLGTDARGFNALYAKGFRAPGLKNTRGYRVA